MGKCEDAIGQLPEPIKRRLMEVIDTPELQLRFLDEEIGHADKVMRDAINDSFKWKKAVDSINEKAPGKAGQVLNDMVSGSGIRQESGMVSLDKYILGIEGRISNLLADELHKVMPKKMGFDRNLPFQRNWVKAIFGDENVTRAAKVAGNAWRTATDEIFKIAQSAGVDISYLKNFGIPIYHDITKYTNFDNWLVDVERYMEVDEFRKSKGTDYRTFMKSIFDNIRTEGRAAIDIEQLGPEYRRTFGKRYKHHRVLKAKDGDSWLAYNAKYGMSDNPLDSMMMYIHTMAREIGLHQIFGSNPQQMFDALTVYAEKRGAGKQSIWSAKQAFDQQISHVPTLQRSWREKFSILKNLQVATKLTATTLLSTTDVLHMYANAMFNGMKPLRMFRNLLTGLNYLKNEDQLIAARLGIMAEYVWGQAVAAHRYSDATGHGIFARAADMTVRGTLLNHWTLAAKVAFELEQAAWLADVAHLPFEKLPSGQKRFLSRYGLADEWDTIRVNTEVMSAYGRPISFLNPAKIPDYDLGARVTGAIREEQAFAVPEPNAKTRGIAALGATKGSLIHEGWSTLTQFKVYPVTMVTQHMMRMLDKSSPKAARAPYAANIMGLGVVFGAIVTQSNELANGRTMRDWDDPDFWAEAFARSGVAGIFWDLMTTDPDLWGGIPGWLAGPTVGDMQAIAKMWTKTWDEVQKASPEDWGPTIAKNFSRQIRQAAFPLRWWQWRVAMERTIMDQLEKTLNPDWADKIERRKKFFRGRGQEYWWEPGTDFNTMMRSLTNTNM